MSDAGSEGEYQTGEAWQDVVLLRRTSTEVSGVGGICGLTTPAIGFPTDDCQITEAVHAEQFESDRNLTTEPCICMQLLPATLW